MQMRDGAKQTEFQVDIGSRRFATRRELLLGGAAITAALMLTGCGSGDGGSGAVGATDAGRTAVTGDLQAQVEQFNRANVDLGAVWDGTSSSISDLSGLATRSVSRAPVDVRLAAQALGIGLNGTRVVYERLINLSLMTDDLGHIASDVSKNNALTGNANLNNPQWLAGMHQQHYAVLRVTGALFKIQLMSGLSELRDWTLARTDPQERLATYGLAADVFNTWVDTLTGVTGISPNASWKLDLSSAVTPDAIATELGRMEIILAQLPFSPGYRKEGADLGKIDDDSLGGVGIQNYRQSLYGAISQLTLNGGAALTDSFLASVDPAKAKYDVAGRLGGTGVGQKLAGLSGGVAKAQSILDALLASDKASDWPGASGASLQNQVRIIGGLFGFLQSLSAALLTTKTALGALISGEQALKNLIDLDALILQLGSVFQKNEWAIVKEDLATLRKQHLANGDVPTVRQIPVMRTSGLEYDQLAAILACVLKLTLPDADANCPDDPKKPVISRCRLLVSGLRKVDGCARTFRNIERCLLGLIADYVLSFSSITLAKWNESSLEFYASSFVRFLRREPGENVAEIPAITSASLLCSGPGFIPTRSLTPVNLGTLAAMPDLRGITNLVGGFSINAK